MTGSVLTAASDTKRTLSISTCLQYIPFQATNYLEKKVPTLLQLDNSPPHSGLFFLYTSLPSALKRVEMEVRIELKASEAQQACLFVCLSLEWISISTALLGCTSVLPYTII